MFWNSALIKKVEKLFPIKLKKIDKIITRVAEQLPDIDPAVTTIVIRSFFEEIRKALLRGEKIKITNYFPSLRIEIKDKRLSPERIVKKICVKMRTPPSMQK